MPKPGKDRPAEDDGGDSGRGDFAVCSASPGLPVWHDGIETTVTADKGGTTCP